MTTSCVRRKKENTCTKDDMCTWNGSHCVNSDYNTLMHICQSKRGKAQIVLYALKLNINTKGMTIPHICKLIEDKTNGDASEFNRLVGESSKPAPVIEYDAIVKIEDYRQTYVVPRSKTSSSSSLNRLIMMPLTKRGIFAKYIQSVVKSSTSLCEFKSGITIVKRIGSPSIHGEAYVANCEYKGKSLYIAVKLMPDYAYNIKELKYYDMFNKYVLEERNPHFPLVYYHTVCDKCKYSGSELNHKQYKDRKKCLVVLNELANGDAESWMNTSPTDSQYAAFWGQLLIAGFSLEHNKLIHNDLHWGNLLHHNTAEWNGKYMRYTVHADTIYIKNTGQHWVLWDFGGIKRSSPHNTSVMVDIYRIGGMWSWMAEDAALNKGPGMSAKQTRLCKVMQQATYNPLITYSSLVRSLYNELQNIDPTIVLINPTSPPPSSMIINATPYMVVPISKRKK